MNEKYRTNLFSFLYLEMIMIIRNRKSLSNFYQILILYALSVLVYFYINSNPLNNSLNNSLVFLMIVSLMSSSFILGHGIYLLTWESTYFCFLMTRYISLKAFFRAKWILFIISAILFSVINIPIIVLLGGNLFLYISFLFFNLGIIPIFIVSISFFNNERASLDRGIFFNYEGYGLWQYLLFIFELMLPGLAYLFVSFVWSSSGAVFTVFSLGLLGILIFILYPYLFFYKRKHIIVLGFKKQ